MYSLLKLGERGYGRLEIKGFEIIPQETPS
jgi:hypothetical protein